jgi:hypothetical protein
VRMLVPQLGSRRGSVPEPTPTPSSWSSRAAPSTPCTLRQPGLGDAWGHVREAARVTMPAWAAPLATTWARPGKERSPSRRCLQGRVAPRCYRRGWVAPCGTVSSPSQRVGGPVRYGEQPQPRARLIQEAAAPASLARRGVHDPWAVADEGVERSPSSPPRRAWGNFMGMGAMVGRRGGSSGEESR